MKRAKTLYAKKDWFRYLSEKPMPPVWGCERKGFPNAGPYPNITGMRRIYGKDACLVMCNHYLFHVDESTYYRIALEG